MAPTAKSSVFQITGLLNQCIRSQPSLLKIEENRKYQSISHKGYYFVTFLSFIYVCTKLWNKNIYLTIMDNCFKKKKAWNTPALFVPQGPLTCSLHKALGPSLVQTPQSHVHHAKLFYSSLSKCCQSHCYLCLEYSLICLQGPPVPIFHYLIPITASTKAFLSLPQQPVSHIHTHTLCPSVMPTLQSLRHFTVLCNFRLDCLPNF